MKIKPLAIDLFCGLGGWADGLLAAGYEIVGFDIEHHIYGIHQYPAQLVVQDVLTLVGSQFRDAALIVASPPCQRYSRMAMPFKRGKEEARRIRADETGASLKDLNVLFDACWRIQKEAIESAGRHIPLVIENVKGAQPWVGRARWNFGSYYLWGDLPALMPVAQSAIKQGGSGRAWFDKELTARRSKAANAIKTGGDWFWKNGSTSMMRRASSGSPARRFASALIAKIPFDLSYHIGRSFYPGSSA